MAEKIMKMIAATTHIDRQGNRVAPEMLAKMAKQANGQNSIRVTFNHNRTLPPYGKGLEAYIEQRLDGELQLVATSVIFDKPHYIQLPDGTPALIQGTSLDARPFAEHDINIPDTFAIYTDPANFATHEGWAEFNREVEEEAGVGIQMKASVRKSFVSPHEIVLCLGGSLPIALAIKAFTKAISKKRGEEKSFREQLSIKTGEKLSAAIAEDIEKFYRVMRAAIWSGVKNMKPDSQPGTYVFQVPPADSNIPLVSFVIVTNDPSRIAPATRWELLEVALADADDLTERFGAKEIHYLLDGEDKWQFNYLLTDSGKVIGKKPCFARRAQVIKLMRKNKQQEIVEYDTRIVTEDTDYNADEELANLEYLVKKGQSVSFGATSVEYEATDPPVVINQQKSNEGGS